MYPQHSNRQGNLRRAFLWHLGTFVWVMALLALIDLVLTGTDQIWIHWVALIWGAMLAVHFVDAFVLGGLLGFHGACWGSGEERAERSDQQPTGV